MFSLKIRPSYLNEDALKQQQKDISFLGRAQLAWKEAVGGSEDLITAIRERNGVLSDRGKEVLQPLVGKEVNQIVCHSWGTQIVYNAILSGYIKPPKLLIVLGAPD